MISSVGFSPALQIWIPGNRILLRKEQGIAHSRGEKVSKEQPLTILTLQDNINKHVLAT
jgi:hypothetical protein